MQGAVTEEHESRPVDKTCVVWNMNNCGIWPEIVELSHSRQTGNCFLDSQVQDDVKPLVLLQ